MQVIKICLLAVLFFPAYLGGEQVQNDLEVAPKGILDGVINKILEMMRPSLENLSIPLSDFDTGPQEIGTLSGNLSNVVIEGLEKFIVKKLDTSFLNLNNLTIIEEKFTAKGSYFVNGTLAFPMGKNDIHFYGNGEFGAELSNFSFSMKLKVHYEDGKKVVKDFDMLIGLGKMKVYLKNLMGGGELEKVFNNLFNDVGLVVFNYYKDPILNTIKPQIKQFITDLLNLEEI